MVGLQGALALLGEELQLVVSEGVVLVVCLALGGLLDAGSLALVLVAFATVVGWVLIFGQDFYLLFELFLVLHSVFLDLTLE